ncbi:MAG: hypothetical protein N4A63_16255 [Vallitalea sp.]|nr:hypothetical protein [Vallitalea sp.]
MHQEITKKEKISILKMLIFIMIGAILLILFNFIGNILNVNSTITDGLTLIIATVLAYIVIREYITFYKYMLIENEFIIQEIIGSKEKILLNINVNQIQKLQPITNSDYVNDKKQKYFTKRTMNKKLKNLTIYYCIYEENDKLNFIEIQPSNDLLELIKNRKAC